MKTFRIGGVHPQDNKQFSAHQPITECPLPKQAIIPLVQHIGAPAQAVVAEGAKVKVGELLAKAGGFVSVNTGGVPDANAIPIPKPVADEAMDAASCIGCGACAAACKNGSAMLFVAAKVSQLALLPQGKIEAAARAKAMVAKMDELGFGNCTNTGACAAECPKSVSLANIARLNREFLCAKFKD